VIGAGRAADEVRWTVAVRPTVSVTPAEVPAAGCAEPRPLAVWAASAPTYTAVNARVAMSNLAAVAPPLATAGTRLFRMLMTNSPSFTSRCTCGGFSPA
jgi:hypothetical protein